ncbi:MAG TPA: hypothetical protein VFZ93_03775 [Albitalea sp.]
MSTLLVTGLLAAVAVAAGEWLLMRAVHRRSVDGLRSHYALEQQHLARRLQQARRQIGALQLQVVAARTEGRQRRPREIAIGRGPGTHDTM